MPDFRSDADWGGSRASTDRRLDAPAFHRNQAAIATELQRLLGDKTGNVLEIGSGTGQHVVTFAATLSHLIWWPSAPDSQHRASIKAWPERVMTPLTGANGVIFLSGDRHLGALYRQTDDVPYDLHEITSSGINRAYQSADEPSPLRLGDVYRQENFGSIDIDWSTGVVTLAVRDRSGRQVRRISVSISSLRWELG